MRRLLHRVAAAALLVSLQADPGFAQDDRGEYPSWLERGTIEFGVGDIGYPFSPEQLEPGYEVKSVHVPDLAARLALGYRFSDRVSLHLGYLRPARWVQYRNINGHPSSHSVWMNVVSASIRGRLPVGGRVSLFDLPSWTRCHTPAGDDVHVRGDHLSRDAAAAPGGGAASRVDGHVSQAPDPDERDDEEFLDAIQPGDGAHLLGR